MKIVIQLVLWAIIGLLGYLLFKSIYGPIQFNQVKEKRYAKVIDNLKDIRSAQLAHQEVTGVFAKDFDALVAFVDTAEFAITQRRDTIYDDVEKNKAFGITEGYFIEETLIDTIGYKSVRDSLFKDSDRYKTMMNIPITGVDAKFEMDAGMIESGDFKLPVFEAKVAKNVILSDQDPDLLAQENQIVSVEDINGSHIIVGSMTEVNTNGNWPKNYDTPARKN
ncbi:hypothetical protein BTO09_14025 [Gilvibacter sp. SZ-19]|uniref:hypothetical protein n=1 Tax=Gilvibacter sp. SZ-19 TaxID=754429 RepID=UPI000B3D32C8|nr:hypothetical protein [Gilvibacter sp. SZ-19]ARV13388.1 hypothetical protein BTO09_14025 [Gilvibacter sp. SZ-19]